MRGVPLGEVINGRLMVSNTPQDARRRDLGRGFRRKFRAPLSIVRVFERIAAAEARTLHVDDRVGDGRVWSKARSPDAVEQIAAAFWSDPKLSQFIAGGGMWHRRLHRRGGTRDQPNSDTQGPHSESRAHHWREHTASAFHQLTRLPTHRALHRATPR